MQQLRWKLRCSPHPTTGDPKFNQNSHSPSLEIPIYLCFAGEFRDDSQHHSRTEREDARGGGTAGSHWLQSFFCWPWKMSEYLFFRSSLGFSSVTWPSWILEYLGDFRQIFVRSFGQPRSTPGWLAISAISAQVSCAVGYLFTNDLLVPLIGGHNGWGDGLIDFGAVGHSQ